MVVADNELIDDAYAWISIEICFLEQQWTERRNTTRHVLSALAAGVGIGIYISRTGSLQIIGAHAQLL